MARPGTADLRLVSRIDGTFYCATCGEEVGFPCVHLIAAVRQAAGGSEPMADPTAEQVHDVFSGVSVPGRNPARSTRRTKAGETIRLRKPAAGWAASVFAGDDWRILVNDNPRCVVAFRVGRHGDGLAITGLLLLPRTDEQSISTHDLRGVRPQALLEALADDPAFAPPAELPLVRRRRPGRKGFTGEEYSAFAAEFEAFRLANPQLSRTRAVERISRDCWNVSTSTGWQRLRSAARHKELAP